MDVLVLVGASLAFFGGLVVVAASVATANFGRGGVERGLTSINRVYRASAAGADRTGAPAMRVRLNGVARTLVPPPVATWLTRQLDYAGNPPQWSVDRVLEITGAGAVVLTVGGGVAGLTTLGMRGAIAGLLLGALLGTVVPSAILYDLAERRQSAIRRTLPDILDTLTVSVEAGLGFDAAVSQITHHGRGPLVGEFARVLQEMRIGRSRADAMRALGRRTNVIELRSFSAIVVQATELGIPIANVLREQSKEMRVRRRQRSEELAQKVPIKILFPLIFCFFPAIFIVILGPGLINILAAFNL